MNTYSEGYDDRDSDLRPAFDPHSQPQLFANVRSRRLVAYLIDLVAIAVLTFVMGVMVFFLGIFTFGLAWALYGALFPLVGIAYSAFTLGGPNHATPGMRVMGLEMWVWHGAPMYPLLAATHAIGFYVSITFLTPLILVVSLFNDRKRLLHDILLGTVLINTEE